MRSFKSVKRRIAGQLEGTRGLVKYAGKDKTYSKREAERSAQAIAAAAGFKSLGRAEMLRRAAAGRRRAARGR